mgnify:CR=1 FL=1
MDRLTSLGGWLHRRAENVAVLMLATMFVAFIVQVAFRYLLNLPVGWASELTLVMWLWLVLWGAGLVLPEREAEVADAVGGEHIVHCVHDVGEQRLCRRPPQCHGHCVRRPPRGGWP